jgi:hypothetical protein
MSECLLSIRNPELYEFVDRYFSNVKDDIALACAFYTPRSVHTTSTNCAKKYAWCRHIGVRRPAAGSYYFV